MAIILNDNTKILAGKPADYWYLDPATNDVYPDVATVNATIPIGYRSIRLVVSLPDGDYWYLAGVQDSDLVKKSSGISSTEFAKYIVVSPAGGDDATAEKYSAVNTFATIEAAKAVFAAGDVILILPGDISVAQLSLLTSTPTLVYELSAGAIVNADDAIGFGSDVSNTYVYGDGILSVSRIKANNGGSFIFRGLELGCVDIAIDTAAFTWAIYTNAFAVSTSFMATGSVLEAIIRTNRFTYEGDQADFQLNAASFDIESISFVPSVMDVIDLGASTGAYYRFCIGVISSGFRLGYINGFGQCTLEFERTIIEPKGADTIGIEFIDTSPNVEYIIDDLKIVTQGTTKSMTNLSNDNDIVNLTLVGGGLQFNNDVDYLTPGQEMTIITAGKQALLTTNSNTPFVSASSGLRVTTEPIISKGRGSAGKVPKYNADGTTSPGDVVNEFVNPTLSNFVALTPVLITHNLGTSRVQISGWDTGGNEYAFLTAYVDDDSTNVTSGVDLTNIQIVAIGL